MLFAREIRVEYEGFHIVVQNSWANGIVAALVSEGFGAARKALGDDTRLLVNGKIVDSSKTWILSPKSTLLLQTCLDDDGRRVVTVFARATWLKNQLKVCINGERIGGDDF